MSEIKRGIAGYANRTYGTACAEGYDTSHTDGYGTSCADTQGANHAQRAYTGRGRQGRGSRHKMSFWDRIPWSFPVAVALIVSCIVPSRMGWMWSLYAIIATIVGAAACYYYFFLYYKLVFAKEPPHTNCLKFWGSVSVKDDSLVHYTKVVIFEELLFRYIPILVLSVLGWLNIFSLAVITLIFVVFHIKPGPKNSIPQLIELFLFFFAQALLYSYIPFFPLLLVPHFTRNIFINELSKHLKIVKGSGAVGHRKK